MIADEAPPQGRFLHSPLFICGLTVFMMIGPKGERGLSPADWRRLAEHLSAHGGEVASAITLLALTVLRLPD